MKPFKMPQEQKLALAEKVQSYVYDEFDKEIGQLAAENLVDFMLKELTPFIYNQALGDARAVIRDKVASLEEELYAIEKPMTDARRR